MNSSAKATPLRFQILPHPLNGASYHRAYQNRPKAENVVGKDVGCKQRPVPLLKIRHGFKSIAGKRGVRPAESNGHQEPPPRICQDSLRRPYQEKPEHQTPCNVNDESSYWKRSVSEPGDDSAQKVAQISAENTA